MRTWRMLGCAECFVPFEKPAEGDARSCKYGDTGSWVDSSRVNCECSILLSSTLVYRGKYPNVDGRQKLLRSLCGSPLNCPVASVGQRGATQLSTEKLGDAVFGHFNTIIELRTDFRINRREKISWIDRFMIKGPISFQLDLDFSSWNLPSSSFSCRFWNSELRVFASTTKVTKAKLEASVGVVSMISLQHTTRQVTHTCAGCRRFQFWNRKLWAVAPTSRRRVPQETFLLTAGELRSSQRGRFSPGKTICPRGKNLHLAGSSGCQL